MPARGAGAAPVRGDPHGAMAAHLAGPAAGHRRASDRGGRPADRAVRRFTLSFTMQYDTKHQHVLGVHRAVLG